jgi:hypothetical protein
MNNKLKNGFLGISVLLLFFLAFSQGCIAAADVPPSPPMLPMTVTGVTLIDGKPAPDGTVVAAYLNGTEFLANTSSGNYSLFIPGTAEDEGKMITFKVDGKDAASSVAWESGVIVTLELPDGKAIYSETAKSNSNINSNSNSNSNSDSNSDSNSNSNSNNNLNSNSNSNSSNSNSNSNLKTGSESLTDNKEHGISLEDSEADAVESSVPEPNMANSKSSSESSEAKEAADSSKSSLKSESAPGFLIVYAVTGILLLVFGSNLGRGSRRNP